MASTMPVLKSFDWRALTLLLLSVATVVGAQSGGFRVAALEARFDSGLLLAEARIDYRLSDTVREALENGVPIVIEQALQLERRRWWWRAERVVAHERRYRLQYHAMSRRYVLTWIDTGESRSYRSLDALLARLGRIDAWPVARRERVLTDHADQLALSSALDIDALPRLLRTVALVDSDWRLRSDTQRIEVAP